MDDTAPDRLRRARLTRLGGEATDESGDEPQVLGAAEARAAALARGDAVALRDLLHERFTWTTHRGEVLDRTEYVDRNTGGRTVWRSQDLEVPHVVVVGDTAVLRADVAVPRRPRGTAYAVTRGEPVSAPGRGGPARA